MKGLFLDWFTPGSRWGIGVSGGGDSIALLHLLVAQFGAAPFQAVLVNHGWNAAFAKKCQQAVAHECKKFGVPLTIIKTPGGKAKTNAEAAARKSRYTAFAQACAEHTLSGIALGHTQTDVAEQFLMRAGKGSGLAGLSGIPAQNTVAGVQVVRPLLTISRADLRTWLKRKKIQWVEDPGNAASTRGKIRSRLKGNWLPEQSIAASTSSLARANAALEQWLAKLLQNVTVTKTGWSCERQWLLQLPEEMSLRLLGTLVKDDTADFAPRTGKRQTLLAKITASEKGTATLGAFKLNWAKGALHGTRLT
ncbi:MAG TPA: tRNA lysidine(34) synthetase TilS [Alphaproteobacteria bacterium]|nr:tRNA lysidine(34) synthetase TilS [Alphaproteobacteria bacterium]